MEDMMYEHGGASYYALAFWDNPAHNSGII